MLSLNQMFQSILCARRLKILNRYDLIYRVGAKRIQWASQLAENLRPVAPKYVFDGGFHHGDFSDLLSVFYPDIEVCACDPIDYRDRWTIDASIPLQFFPVALAEEMGSAELKLVNDPQLNSLLSFDRAYERSFGPTYQSTEQTKVIPIQTIDTLLETVGWTQCDLLKLDLQGVELSALKGATRSMEKIGAIYLEVSFEPIYRGQAVFCEIDNFLRKAGFKLSKIVNPQGGKHLLQADALYLNNQFYPPC
jgi:FkbM family methyltransferase